MSCGEALSVASHAVHASPSRPSCSPEAPIARRWRFSGPRLTSWRRTPGATRMSSPRSYVDSSPSSNSVSVPSSTRYTSSWRSWAWMRPRWPGCSTIWLSPKLVTPSSARRRTKRLSASGCRRVVAVPSSMAAILCEQRRDPRDRVVGLRLVDDERGQEADRLGAGRVADEAALQEPAADDAGRVAGHVEADHEPALADAHHARRLLEAGGDPLAERAHARVEVRVLEHVERGVGGGGDDRPAGERRAVVAGLEGLAQALAGDQRADRQAAAERLGGRHRVGHDAGLLERPQRAAAAEAALDLVVEQRRAVGVARLARGVQQLVGQRPHAALALDRLEQDGRGPLAHRAGDGLGRRLDGHEPRYERGERRLLGLLRGRAQRAVRAPVEAAVQHDDLAAAFGLTRELQRRLDRLGARVREEDGPAERALGQPLGEADHRLGVEEVADVQQLAGLGADRRDDLRVAVADARDRYAGEEVEVLVALLVPQPRALAADEAHRVARVRRHQVVRAGRRLRAGHRAARIFVPRPALVKSSSSSACGTRPSTMCACVTPPWIAFRHAPSFGRMPPAIVPSAASTSSAPASETTLSGSAGLRSQPGTSVRNMTL